jgi:hypothetical protein
MSSKGNLLITYVSVRRGHRKEQFSCAKASFERNETEKCWAPKPTANRNADGNKVSLGKRDPHSRNGHANEKKA